MHGAHENVRYKFLAFGLDLKHSVSWKKVSLLHLQNWNEHSNRVILITH